MSPHQLVALLRKTFPTTIVEHRTAPPIALVAYAGKLAVLLDFGRPEFGVVVKLSLEADALWCVQLLKFLGNHAVSLTLSTDRFILADSAILFGDRATRWLRAREAFKLAPADAPMATTH